MKNVAKENKPILHQNSTGTARIFDLSNTSGVQISGIAIDETGVVGTGPTVYLNNTTNAVIDIDITNAASHSIGALELTGSSTYNTITARMTNLASTCVGLTGSGVQYNSIINGQFTDCGIFGIGLGEGANRNLIQNNTTYSNGGELIGLTSQTHYNRIIGNHAEGTGDNGISVFGDHTLVTGNTVIGNNNAGIGVWGSFNTITGNTCINNNQVGTYWSGISIMEGFGGTGQFNVVSGNACDDDQASPTQPHDVDVTPIGQYVPWASGQAITAGTYENYGLNIYYATNSGTTGVTPPTCTSGTCSDGGVTWQYRNSFLVQDSQYGNIVSGNLAGRSSTGVPFNSSTGWQSDGLLAFAGNRLGLGTTTPMGQFSINQVGSNPSFVIGSQTLTNFMVTKIGSNVAVGVGTSNPAPVVASRTLLQVGDTGSGYGAEFRIVNNLAQGRFFNNGSMLGFGSDSATDVFLYTNGGANDRFHISSAGNIGLASTTPWARLSIVGAAGATTPLFTISTSTSDFATSTAFMVDQNGNVGIGTASPFAPLQIVNTSAGSGATQLVLTNFSANTGSAAQIDFNVTSSNSILGRIAALRTNRLVAGDTDIIFYSLSGCTFREKMRIQDTGNIGIGTSTPWAKLSVAGAFNGTIPLFTISSSTASATSTAFMVNQNGNVGIGTTTPSTALTVNGSITPNVTNTSTLGNATYLWNAVYATNGTIQTSDARLKDNIASTTYGLDQVLQLRPISYTWKAHPEQGTYLGFIAQEVQPVLPETVTVGDDANHTLGLTYTEFIPVIVRAIQQLAAKLSDLADTVAGFAEHFVTKDLVATNITGDKAQLHELCLDDVCVTRSQLAAVLALAGQSAGPAPSAPDASSSTPTSPNTPPTAAPTPSADSTSSPQASAEPPASDTATSTAASSTAQ